MSGAGSPSDHQRAFGALRVAFKRRGELTVLDDLRQEGCLKARLPRPVDWAEAIMLNSSGGVVGGDRLDVSGAVGPGARATFTAQAAERFYRALPGSAPARLRNRIGIGAGAAAEWLPQDSILFDGCALDRVLEVEMAEDGWFLGVETLVFGRAAMGETIRSLRLRDGLRVRRGGRLLLHDAVRLLGEVASLLARPAITGGGLAVATIVHVAPDAAGRLDDLRDALAAAPAQCGASTRDGMLIGRMVAADGACLRAAIVAGLASLRGGRSLPRVWSC